MLRSACARRRGDRRPGRRGRWRWTRSARGCSPSCAEPGSAATLAARVGLTAPEGQLPPANPRGARPGTARRGAQVGRPQPRGCYVATAASYVVSPSALGRGGHRSRRGRRTACPLATWSRLPPGIVREVGALIRRAERDRQAAARPRPRRARSASWSAAERAAFTEELDERRHRARGPLPRRVGAERTPASFSWSPPIPAQHKRPSRRRRS